MTVHILNLLIFVVKYTRYNSSCFRVICEDLWKFRSKSFICWCHFLSLLIFCTTCI